MKKLLPVLSLVLVLFACRKAEQTGPAKTDTTLHDVKFTVADIATGTVPMSTTAGKTTMAVTKDLKAYVNRFYYRVFDSTGFPIKIIEQDSTSANFGIINDRLAAGTYKVVMVASKNTPITFTDINMNDINVVFAPAKNWLWNDTFHTSFKFTVAELPVTQTVKLERLTAAFNVVIEDAIPADISKLTVVFSDYGALDLDGTTTNFSSYSSRAPVTFTYPVAASEAGIKNKMLNGFLVTTFERITFIIRGYNSKNVIVYQKSIPDVRFNKSERTTLSGSLFTPANLKTSTASSSPVAVSVSNGASNLVRF